LRLDRKKGEKVRISPILCSTRPAPDRYCKKTFTAKHNGAKIKTPIAIACPEACAAHLEDAGIWCSSPAAT